MKKWEGYRFDQADYNETGYDEKAFRRFANAFKKHLLNSLDMDFEVVGFSIGYYYFTGFVEDTAKGGYVYFSIPDVRYEPNGWRDRILIRTAKNTKDYSGGRNNYTDLNHIGEDIENLIR